jgi:hypothetical protein
MNKAVKITLGVVTLLAIGGVAYYFIRKRTKKTIGKIYAIKDSGKGWLKISVMSNRENYLKKALKEYDAGTIKKIDHTKDLNDYLKRDEFPKGGKLKIKGIDDLQGEYEILGRNWYDADPTKNTLVSFNVKHNGDWKNMSQHDTFQSPQGTGNIFYKSLPTFKLVE